MKVDYYRRCMLYEEYMAYEFGITREKFLRWLEIAHKEDYDKELLNDTN